MHNHTLRQSLGHIGGNHPHVGTVQNGIESAHHGPIEKYLTCFSPTEFDCMVHPGPGTLCMPNFSGWTRLGGIPDMCILFLAIRLCGNSSCTCHSGHTQ